MEQQMGAMPEALPGGQSTVSGEAGELPAPAKIQMLATEHWSLLATRSLSWTESFSRTSMFLSSLTGAVVALALVAQAMPGEGFVVFALLLLPVVLFLGVATYARLVAVNVEDAHWVVGMNRLRHAYTELAPDIEQYFISGVYDDAEGVMKTFAATPGPGQFLHGFVTTPGTVAVIDSVLAGVLAAVIVGVAGVDFVVSVIIGGVAFVLMLALLMYYQSREWASYLRNSRPLFPRPPDG
jgi:hypothetical protein